MPQFEIRKINIATKPDLSWAIFSHLTWFTKSGLLGFPILIPWWIAAPRFKGYGTLRQEAAAVEWEHGSVRVSGANLGRSWI